MNRQQYIRLMESSLNENIFGDAAVAIGKRLGKGKKAEKMVSHLSSPGASHAEANKHPVDDLITNTSRDGRAVKRQIGRFKASGHQVITPAQRKVLGVGKRAKQRFKGAVKRGKEEIIAPAVKKVEKAVNAVKSASKYSKYIPHAAATGVAAAASWAGRHRIASGARKVVGLFRKKSAVAKAAEPVLSRMQKAKHVVGQAYKSHPNKFHAAAAATAGMGLLSLRRKKNKK